MSKKIVVITGGAGFLGSHLCDRFIGAGLKVYCVDNFITGNLKNIEHLLKNKSFKLITHDISRELHIAGRIDCDDF